MYEREKEELEIAQIRVLELEKRCCESEAHASTCAQEAKTLQDRVEEMQRQGEVRHLTAIFLHSQFHAFL